MRKNLVFPWDEEGLVKDQPAHQLVARAIVAVLGAHAMVEERNPDQSGMWMIHVNTVVRHLASADCRDEHYAFISMIESGCYDADMGRWPLAEVADLYHNGRPEDVA